MGGWGWGRSSPAESGSLSSAARSAPLDEARQRSWDAPCGRTRRGGAGWSIRTSPSVPSSPQPSEPTYACLPEHHLDGRFWPLRALLQVPRGVPVAATRVNHPCPCGSLNLPESVLTRPATRVPPCPALHTELAPPESGSFPSPVPSPFTLGLAIHTYIPHSHRPPSPGNHPSGKARPAQGQLVKDLPKLPPAWWKSLELEGGFGSLRISCPWPVPSTGTTRPTSSVHRWGY